MSPSIALSKSFFSIQRTSVWCKRLVNTVYSIIRLWQFIVRGGEYLGHGLPKTHSVASGPRANLSLKIWCSKHLIFTKYTFSLQIRQQNFKGKNTNLSTFKLLPCGWLWKIPIYTDISLNLEVHAFSIGCTLLHDFFGFARAQCLSFIIWSFNVKNLHNIFKINVLVSVVKFN